MTSTRRLLFVISGVTVGTFLLAGAAGRRHQSAAESPKLTLRFENERVRVLELKIAPGERETLHTHPQYVLYALSNYRVRNFQADGSSRVFERRAGDVYWGEPITHGGENVGKTDVHALIVELKNVAH